jgi:branched-chain amino acid transport system permease protein
MRRLFSSNLWLLVLFLFFLLFPVVFNDPYLHHLFILSFIFAILVSSWNILFGFLGVFSFGHQAFFGLGAYISAILVVRSGVETWVGFLAGGFGAALASLIISWPTFRLKGPYVAIVTLAFAEVLRMICSNWVSLTRGQLGLSVPTLFSGNSRLPFYYLIFLLFAATMIVLTKMIRSSFGLAAIAIRESQEAGESLGINVVRYKRLSFVLTSFMAGVTGAFYAHYIGILTPDIMGIQVIFSILVMGLFGGIGTLAGPVLGSFTLTFLAEYLRDLETYRFLIYSLIIILAVLFLPGGLAGGFRILKQALIRKTGAISH